MKQIANASQIDEAIENMAQTIIKKYSTTPLFICLLRGGAPFASKLMFAIAKLDPDYHPELDYMTISTYGGGREAGKPRIVTDLAPSTVAKDRAVIVLDDVLDTGTTADFVFRHLASLGAATCELAVLCDKPSKHLHNISANYIGFTAGDNWLTGMGMDNEQIKKEAGRWMQGIYEV